MKENITRAHERSADQDVIKVNVLLDIGSLAGSGDFTSETVVQNLNSSELISYDDVQKLVCSGVDKNCCYQPLVNLKVTVSFVNN